MWITNSSAQSMPVLRLGHTANLVYDDGRTRVWSERGTTEDGWEIDYPLSVEQFRDGRWETVQENAAFVEV